MVSKTTPLAPASPPEAIQEVEFALVLANIIESLKNDPTQLRSTVYELARIKLQDQLVNLDAADAERLIQSLEVAIRGVEDFSIRKDHPTAARSLPAAGSQVLLPPRSPASGTRRTLTTSAAREPNDSVPVTTEDFLSSEQPRRAIDAPLPTPIRTSSIFRSLFVVIVVFAVAVIAYQQLGSIKQQTIPGKPIEANNPQGSSVSQSVPAPPPPAVDPAAASLPVRPAGPLPTTFGVYAISANKLFELEMLPIRAPDRRIAMSAVINIPTHTTLPDGKIRFIVFRRDSSMNAIERPEVRVVAKVARAVTFEDGKANVSDKDDSWIVRNISRELKAAPIKDNPEMYEILDEAGEAPLSPGRYALILKGQAYDFTVEGTVTDLNQCLERTTAANGSFFSECRKR